MARASTTAVSTSKSHRPRSLLQQSIHLIYHTDSCLVVNVGESVQHTCSHAKGSRQLSCYTPDGCLATQLPSFQEFVSNLHQQRVPKRSGGRRLREGYLRAGGGVGGAGLSSVGASSSEVLMRRLYPTRWSLFCQGVSTSALRISGGHGFSRLKCTIWMRFWSLQRWIL